MDEDGGRVVTHLVLDDRTTIGLNKLKIGMKNFGLTGKRVASDVGSAWGAASASVTRSASKMGGSLASLGVIAKAAGLSLQGAAGKTAAWDRALSGFALNSQRFTNTIGSGSDAMRQYNAALVRGHMFTDAFARSAGVAQNRVSDLSAKTEDASTKINGFNTWIRRVSSALGVLTVFALIGATKAMLEFAAAMEDAEVKIQSLVGISKELSFKWFRELPDLARKTGAGFKELGDALYYITSAGIRGAETMETLRQVSMASVAGLGEMGTIARTVVSAMNAWGRENISAAMSTSVLLNTVKEGQLVATELAGTFSKVMPIASALGVSMQEMGAAIAIMSRSGMDAAKATTGLRRLLLALTSPSKQAEEAMNDLGLSSAYFRKVLKGPGGLQEAMMALAIATDAEFEAIDRIIPNLRALTPALTLVKDESGDVLRVFKSLKETKPGDTFEAHAKGAGLFSRKLGELKAEFSDLFDLIGSAGNEAMLQPMEDLGSVINSLSNAIRYYNESGPGKFLQFLDKLSKMTNPANVMLHPGDSFEASRELGEKAGEGVQGRIDEYNHLREKYGEFVAAMKFLGSTELKDRKQVIADLIEASKKRNDARRDDLEAAAIEARLQADLAEEAARVKQELAEKEAIEAQKILDAANKRKEAADVLAAAKYALDNAIAGGADLAELMRDHASAYAVAIAQGGGYVAVLKKIDAQNAKDETQKRTAAIQRANAEIKKAIKGGATFNKLMRDHGKAMRLVTGSYIKMQPILDKLRKKREDDAKATKKQADADDKLLKKGDEVTALFIAELDALEQLHPKMADDIALLRDQALAYWDTGKGTDWLIARLEGLGVNLDDLKNKWGINRQEMDSYQKAAQKAGKTLDKAFESFTSGALQAALTGNFDDVIDSYSTLGEDLAKSLSDSFTTAFSAEDSIGSLLEGFLNKDEVEKWTTNITAGVAAMSTAYGIYEGARAGEVSAGEGALAGAMMGAQIGSMFPGYGTAIGAVIGAVAGAVMASSISESQDQFWIDYGAGVPGGSQITETDLDASTINKFQDDLNAVIRITQSGLMDIAHLFRDKTLYSDLSKAFRDMHFMVGGRTADMQTMMETILSDEVPQHVLQAARASFASAFKDIGFGELFRGAWDQMRELPGDEALDLFQKVAMGAIALNEAMEDLDWQSLVDELDMTSFDVFVKNMSDGLEEVAALQEKLINELDLGEAALDAAEIAELIKASRDYELQMLARIKQAQEAINVGFDSFDRTMALTGATDPFKIEYFTRNLIDAMSSLGEEGLSTEEVQRYAATAQQELQALFGMFDESELGQSLFTLDANTKNKFNELADALGVDVDFGFGGDSVKDFFAALSASMRGDTDIAFDAIRDEIKEWSDALELAAQNTADALNALATTLSEYDPYENWDINNPNTQVPEGMAADVIDWDAFTESMSGAFGEWATPENFGGAGWGDVNWSPFGEFWGDPVMEMGDNTLDALDPSKALPPTVIVEIDGTLEPLIALIDMRIETARTSGGGVP